MKNSQIIAILALVVQLGNAGSVFLGMLPADVALYVAASLGAVQAFLGKIQEGSKKKQ